ncbi:MAG: pyridoxamine 5'-phosphate oxidase family protein [Acidimicrobiales bacterium]|nr:pyridoxamine 5'-phosphate oxidase family protein [Acidimicrobiales bacterium]
MSLASVGRIGASIDALPVILPVYFTLFGESVLFRTILGTKLDAATRGAVVAFQAEGDEPLSGTSWSVLLQGVASAVSDEDGHARAKSIPIGPWSGGTMDLRLVRIEATNISGRRFRIAGEGPQVELPEPPPL